MNWKRIPSLSSLRAFEALSRNSGPTLAAKEINVTHAAISQHVRLLEEYFGRPLVYRNGKKTSLNDTGQLLAHHLSEGFQQIARGVESVHALNSSRAMNISVTPSFAENWLMPRLGQFWADHPDIQIMVHPTTRLVNLREEDIDLAIRYGHGDWDLPYCEKLFEAGFAIVAAPSLLDKNGVKNFECFRELPWLFESGRPEARLWIESLGINLDEVETREFSTSSLLLAATRQGIGVSAQPTSLVERDLSQGSLREFVTQEESGLGYYLIRPTSEMPPNLKKFIKWLHCCG